MRLTLKQSEFIHESAIESFFKILTDPRREVFHFHIIYNDIQIESFLKILTDPRK